MAQQITNIEKIVQSFAATNNEVEKKWSDVLKRNTENINKNTQVAQQAKILMEQSHQLKEEENRKNNAIITGVTEQDDSTAIQQIKELMTQECFAKNSEPIQAMRLGKKTEDQVQKRPIKVRFDDEQSKWEFIKRFNNHALREKQIFCKLDESQAVRNQQFQLRQEVRSLRTENGTNEYRIRNMQIQEKKDGSGDWKVMKPVSLKKSTEC
jgi:hypothetical protein